MNLTRNSVVKLLGNAQKGVRLASSKTANDAKPVLYSLFSSSCSWRVRTVLGLKKIPYEIAAISLNKTDPVNCFANEYKELNPMQQVPTLQIDGKTLCDSVAIMHYLEETRPEYSILPKDPAQRAKVREIVEIICSGIQPLQNRRVLEYVGEEKGLEWAQHWIARGFRALETVLSASAGKHCVGDEISMADCCLVPQVFNARRYKVNLDPYPTIVRLDKTLASHAAFIAGHPHNQPDYPENKK